ncbi:MAG TPA: PLP-dependent aspartate aminotransferase family protein [Sporichthyaceae bacterium]|nr:PLP-dependent aspartate aminotransferase family protein [Sporichthyaceae bacterium]
MAEHIRPERTRPERLAPETIAVIAGRPERQPDAPLNHPLVMASTYVAGGELEYGRYGNPTWRAFETALGGLEGGHGLAYPSGLAGFGAVLDLLPPDAVVVAPRHAYLGSLGYLARQGQRHNLTTRLVDIADTEATMKATVGAHLVLLESPTNPALEIAELALLCAAGRDSGAMVLVDNTFATPFGQRPLDLGAHVVMHSATKYIAGHSDAMLGAVVCAELELWQRLEHNRGVAGVIPGPLECWLALRGLRTLHLRVERAAGNAAVLARRLADHSPALLVRYPGLPGDPGHARAAAGMRNFGSMISVEFADAATADTFCGATRLWVTATSLGGVESTLERRRRWPGEAATIPEGLVRMSVGIEDVEDLWNDLAQALAALS